MAKFRMEVLESERGWGQTYEWWELKEEVTTIEQARTRVQEFNAQNTTSTAPDWYMQAGQIQMWVTEANQWVNVS
jgi:hypothetical protein